MNATNPTTPALDPFGGGPENWTADETPSSPDYDCWAWLDELTPEELEAFERWGNGEQE